MACAYLFVPGDSERKFTRACSGAAQALILDLEDSVAPDQKIEARRIVQGMLHQAPAGKALWVRVNALDTGLTIADLAAVVPAKPFGIVLPKCRGGADLAQVSHYLDAFEAAHGLNPQSIKILVIATETGEAVFGMGTYRNVTPRLAGLSWGAEDLAADIGAMANRVNGAYTEPFRVARALCLHAAAAAGVPAIDTVCVDLEDPAVLINEAREARRDGFAGKLAIHPKHVDDINTVFTPDAAQLAWAHKVIAAFAAQPNAGALRMDGMMIDRPHLRLARRLVGDT